MAVDRATDSSNDTSSRAPANAPALAHTRRAIETLFGPPRQRPFAVRYWDGTVERAGRAAPDLTLVVRRPGALRRMLLPPSELSIVESYLSGDVDVEGKLADAMTMADAINDKLKSPRVLASLARDLVALPKDDADDVTELRASHVVTERGAKHAPRRDEAAIRYHYDVGNGFYKLWLDQRMVYSCAYFRAPDDTLEAAQEAKLDLVCRKLRLLPGERMLDIGCGWGALVMHAARHYGVQAVGITLSKEQASLASRRIADAGLRESCHVELRDYRDAPAFGPFDKIASVGMIEHVGVDHLPEYFTAAWRALRSGGLFLNHGIVNTESGRETSWRSQLERRLWRRDAFIDQYVFPDGKLGPYHAVVAAAESARFEVRDAESLREHYVLTLEEWLRRLELHSEEALALVGAHRFRVWKLYMTAAAHGFRTGRLNVVQTLLAKPHEGVSGLPLTREDLYK